MIKLEKGFAKTYVNDSEVESWLAAGWSISGAPSVTVERSLEELSKVELTALASERGIPLEKKATKAQIIDALNAPAEEVEAEEEVEEPVDAPSADETAEEAEAEA